MTQDITTILIVNGAEKGEHARGNYNTGLVTAAITALAPYTRILKTDISEGYDVGEEISKYKEADVVIYQYPIFWFMVPSSLKRYMDDVFSHGEFFKYTEGPYGSGGLMQGKKVLLSTTWNAPLEAFNDEEMFFDGISPDEAILAMRKAHQYCGFTELPHFSCHNVVKDPQFELNKARFTDHLLEILVFRRTKNVA